MNKQNYLSVSFNRLLFIILILVFLNFKATAKQQTVLLDANGKPISNEVLLLLSGSSDNFSAPKKTIKDKEKTLKTQQTKKVSEKKYVDNPILEQELLEAMKAGKVVRVKQLLRARIRPTYKNYKGETPLGIAVTRGWASMVVQLLNSGANVNEKGGRGVTLLHKASALGLTDVAKVLIKHGLDPSKKTDKNWTPLHIAARYGHWELVQHFVKSGVDPDIRNSDGQTALGLARHLRHQGVIKILSRVTSVSSLDFDKKRKKGKKRRKSKKRVVKGISDKEALILLRN